MQKPVLIELNYLAPVPYYALLAKSNAVVIEAKESFAKSSYRNRCEILGANGRQILSIPIQGGRSHRQQYTDVRIDNTTNWQKIHWNAICSAYGRSPYFEHYSIYFEKYYEQEWELLFELNWAILKTTLDLLKLDLDIEFSIEFEKSSDKFEDFRNKISPKMDKDQSDEIYKSKPYLQVFGDRFEFQKKMSIVDLLFNEGPDARSIL